MNPNQLVKWHILLDEWLKIRGVNFLLGKEKSWWLDLDLHTCNLLASFISITKIQRNNTVDEGKF